MFKPLIRTMPSLSGNIKLVCFLSNYNKVDDDVFEVNVRAARLHALSSQLSDKYINISLLQSSYEWDVRSFYTKYSDVFYKKLFDVNQKELPMYIEYGTNKNRNTDFEFGVKRISYIKSNKQFGFFAPIYIEGANDIPDYFEINIDIQNSIYKTTRKIRINFNNDKNNQSNYLGRYLQDYASKIDNNVIYINKDDNKALYYGIDVISGGFGVKHDYVISSVFNKQNSILNHDNIINAGFERNSLIIKQIIPLSFYFSLNDILTDVETESFYGAELTISGKWIKNGSEIKLHDFSTDYNSFCPTIPKINMETGSMTDIIPSYLNINGKIESLNIMDIDYPSMKESSFYKYRFSNKFTPNFNRWKLKYSTDEHPYICNSSCAFSLYQRSTTKYGEFPSNYTSVTGIVSKKPYYLNLILPLNGGEERYSFYSLKKYKDIQNSFASNWFEIFRSINDVFEKSVEIDEDNKVFFNGILYNLQNIYNSRNVSTKIDRFGVFVNPIFNCITINSQNTNNPIYATNTIIKENSKYITKPNCHSTDNILSSLNSSIFAINETKIKLDELSNNRIFVHNTEDNGDFINISKYGIDWYKINDYIKISDASSYFTPQMYANIKKASSEGHDIIPIYRLSNIVNEDGTLCDDIVDNDNIYISDFGSQSKTKIIRGLTNNISSKDIKTKTKLYSKLLYRKGFFIDRNKAKDTIKNHILEQLRSQFQNENGEWHLTYTNEYMAPYIDKIDSMTSYQFYPVLCNGGENYATNVFKDEETVSGRFYGDELSMSSYNVDRNFIYLDPYNINHIVHKYNNSWLDSEEPHNKLAYIVEYNNTSHCYYEPTRITSGPHIDLLSELINKQSDVEVEENLFEIISALYNRIDVKIESEQDIVKPNITNYYPRLILRLTKCERSLSFKLKKYFFTQDDALTYIQQGKVRINGVVFYLRVLNELYKFLTIDPSSSFIDLSPDNVHEYINCLYASLGITQSLFNDTPWLFMDKTTSAEFKVKFLNLQHLKFYARELYKNANQDTSLNENGYFALYNNVYVRKRCFDINMTVNDVFIPIYEFLSMKSNPIDKDAEISNVLSHISWDEDTQLFYFNDLVWTGSEYLIGRKSINPTYIGNPNDYMSNQTATTGETQAVFDNKKFLFELVFNKRMLKVDDNIWKLINLDEKYAAPYKDLYLYEIERDEEFNSNLLIRKLYKSNITKPKSKTTRGVLKPLFNIATIEDKDSAKIYTEYSINNIVKTSWEDYEIINYNENGVQLSSSLKHFYRHNTDNEVVMYDLSTINKDIPFPIGDKKYFYKSNWDDGQIFDYSYTAVDYNEYESKEEHIDAVNSYIATYCRYFTNTYDLFGSNKVEFKKYSTYEVVPVLTDTYSYISYSYISYSTVLDKENYIKLYSGTKMMEHLEYDSTYTEPGNYVLNTTDISNSYVIKQIITPYKPKYLVKTYIPIEVEKTGQIIENKSVYTYFDSLNIFDDCKINTYTASTYSYVDINGHNSIGYYENVYTYGFFIIDVNINNTINSLNIESLDGEYVKYVSYINGINLHDNSNTIPEIYKQLMPFVKNNPLQYMLSNSTGLVMYPKKYTIPLNYRPTKVTQNNFTYYDIIFDKNKYSSATFERYFDNITPLIIPANNVITYNMKYKDTKKSFKPSYFTNETIYPLQTSLSIYPGVRVYNMNKQSEYEIKYDTEWKHFNHNRVYNLEEQFTYTFENYLTKDEVVINESDLVVYNIFKEHYLNNTLSKLDDKTIEWAFTKYNVKFACQSVDIDLTTEDKLYKLEIFFTLF